MNLPIRILLRNGNAWTAEEIARHLKQPLEEVRDELIRMQDADEVFLRNGFYRIAERVR